VVTLFRTECFSWDHPLYKWRALYLSEWYGCIPPTGRLPSADNSSGNYCFVFLCVIFSL